MANKTKEKAAEKPVAQESDWWSLRLLPCTQEGIKAVSHMLEVPVGFVVDLMWRAYTGRKPLTAEEWKVEMKKVRQG